MYRFQISASTQTGEFIGIVGSTPELGYGISKNVFLYVQVPIAILYGGQIQKSTLRRLWSQATARLLNISMCV